MMTLKNVYFQQQVVNHIIYICDLEYDRYVNFIFINKKKARTRKKFGFCPRDIGKN